MEESPVAIIITRMEALLEQVELQDLAATQVGEKQSIKKGTSPLQDPLIAIALFQMIEVRISKKTN